MAPIIVGFLIAIPMIYGLEWFLMGRPYVPKFLANLWQGNARSIQKMEKDAQAALMNLHETKKRINAEYRENWDNEFRLLLPPPEAPKGREALKLKSYYKNNGLYASPEPNHFGSKGGVAVNIFQELVPIGFYGSGGSYWYAFNNLSGHPHKVMFISVNSFEQASNKFFAFLPEVKKQGDEWTWQTSKVKTLASNLKDIVIEIRV